MKEGFVHVLRNGKKLLENRAFCSFRRLEALARARDNVQYYFVE